jgi:hypothetical protein
MESCKLYIKNLGLSNQFYEFIFSRSTFDKSAGSIINEQIAKMEHYDLSQIRAFAESYGVEGKELNLAVEVMEENYHNVADFGIAGSFIFSEFTDPAQ